MDKVREMLNAPPPPPPLPSPELVAAWTKLWKEIQAAIAANPGRKDALSQAAAGIPELIKANNGKEATARMEIVRQALAAGSGPAGAPDAAALKAEWGKLIPRIKGVNNAALNQATAAAGPKMADLVSHGKLAEAQLLIDQLTAQLKNLKSEAAKLTPADITAAWQKLVPEIEKKSRVHPEVKDAAMRARKQAEELVKTGKLEAAKQAIEDLAELVAKMADEAAKPKAEPESRSAEDPRKAEYERKWEQMDKDIQRALREGIGDVSAIRSGVALAQERAGDGDYASALRVLAGLETMLKQGEIAEDDTPSAGLVEYRKKLLAFDTARKKAEGQIKAMAAAIVQEVPDETEVAEEMSEQLEDQMEGIQILIDQAIDAAKDDRASVDPSLKTEIRKVIADLESSNLLQELEKNPLGIAVDIRKTLTDALKQVLESMPVEV
jgi:hypothetical protein